MRSILAAILLAALPQAAYASDAGAAGAVDTVSAALAKGYGATCSLEMQPVASGGYYPCLDIGPYRFVAEYGRTRGFVLTEGQPPFPVLVSDAAGARFEYQGTWVQDLPARVAQWWAAQSAPPPSPDTEAARAAADDAVTRYLRSLEPAQPPQPAPEPVVAQPQPPQVIYVMPPNFTPAPQQPQQGLPAAAPGQIPVTGVPFPQVGGTAQGLVPGPGGVLVAPGVVSYPPPQ